MAMVLRNFKPNDAAFKEMAVGPEIRAALKETAEKAKLIAEGLSASFVVTGDYEKSFEITETTLPAFGVDHPHPAAAARLTNTSDHAAAVEWGYQGSSHAQSSSAHRVLGKTLAALEATP
jgi:hypothetical protein